MDKRKRLIVLFCIALCSQVYAQVERRILGIEEMYRLADENSSSIRSFKTEKKVLDESVKATQSQRLPDISASLSMSYLGNGNIWDRDFTNGQSVHFPHFGNNFAFEASQMIFTGGAINSSIALAELSQQMSALDLQKNRQDIRFLLVGFYLNIFQLNNQLQVIDRNIELTKLVITNMESRFKQGTVLSKDITRYELQLKNQDLQRVRVIDERKIINHQLVTTLHLPTETEIVPDSTLLNGEMKTLTETDWQQLAAYNNMNLQQSNLAIKINEQKIKLQKSDFFPKISLVAADHLDGPVTIEIPALNNNFNYWYIGLGVKYNISSLFKSNKKLNQTKIELYKSQVDNTLVEEQIENAVQAGYTNLLTSVTELQTQQKSVKLAEENYSVTNNRYKNELALLTDMLDASNMKLSAELNLVNARIQLIFNYYKMKYITHTL